MMRLLRRLVLVAVVIGAIAVVVRRRRDHLVAGAGTPPSSGAWPPIVEDDPPRVEPDASEPDPDQVWSEPIDGECPDGYPIKANAKSGIFHVPGGRSYDRTVPERCYPTAEAAEADGYRAAKA